ncbi:MAG: prepilin-type N-terminal cleavage/methylation domain-containing protein [bacterium]
MKSFTLIEVIIVIAIIGIMTATVVSNQSSAKRDAEVLNAAKKLESEIRGVQNNVMSAIAEDIGGVKIVPCTRGIGTLCGGVDQYKIGYEYMNGNLECNTNYMLTTLNENELENLLAAQNLSIGNITIDSVNIDGANQCGVSLLFSPPEGLLFVNGAINKTVEIFIKHTHDGDCNDPRRFCRVVKINPFGQVSIE